LKLAYLPSPGKVVYVFRLEEQELIENAIEICGSLNLIINDIIVGFEEEETIELLVGIC
jgi:nicotinamide-nucleotide amidase